MPVMSKAKHRKFELELRSRFENLLEQFGSRDLDNPHEGAGKGVWTSPDSMCATNGGPMDLRMAVEDFKVILAEVKALK